MFSHQTDDVNGYVLCPSDDANIHLILITFININMVDKQMRVIFVKIDVVHFSGRTCKIKNKAQVCDIPFISIFSSY